VQFEALVHIEFYSIFFLGCIFLSNLYEYVDASNCGEPDLEFEVPDSSKT
jgi:hypothetical protein